MTISDPFADERIQFFLRNREDIKTWAAIERDVIAATRELLARAQPIIEERLLEIDSQAIVGRHDSGQWERILTRHEQWPPAVGLALEWSRSVDPLGANRPKLGVFWWADPSTLEAPRTRLVTMVDKNQLQGLDWRVPLDGVWPVGLYLTSTPDWWRTPDFWIEDIVRRLSAVWPLVAQQIDQALVGVDWQSSALTTTQTA